MRLRSLLACAALAGGAVFYTPDANACGGCFPPQGENNSVVTDHRMVLSVSQTQSTLYDQIEYSGEPSQFAWVLPISGTVDIGLSAQSLFSGLDTLTSVVVQEPPRNCPPPPVECRSFANNPQAGSASAASSSSGSSGSGGDDTTGVTVIKTEVVGPYETVQLHPTTTSDVAAVEKWLTDHSFTIPDDIKPVIAQYVKESFNFLALRLVPGKGVQSMRPVRVTTQGANVALPLRMVAAGTGATVGITLWVVSQGRYEPSNFQSFIVKDEDITWDWDASASDFKTVRANKEAVSPGKLWEIESSISTFSGQIQNAANFQGGGNGGADYLPDTSATAPKTASEVQQADYTALFAGLGGAGGSNVHITRLRADLSRTALTQDLTIGAATDQSDLARTRQPKLEKSQPLCPVYNNCTVVAQLPRDQAIQQSSGSYGGTQADGGALGSASPNAATDDGGTFTCRSTAPRSTSPAFTVAFAFVAIAIGRAIRERRRQR